MQQEFYREKKALCVILSAAMVLACLFGGFTAEYRDITEVCAQEKTQTATTLTGFDIPPGNTAGSAVTAPFSEDDETVTTTVTPVSSSGTTTTVSAEYDKIILTGQPYLDIFTPEYSECYVGNSFSLEYDSYDPPYFSGEISWNSSNEEIASVDENGCVTIKGVGIVTISAVNSCDSDSVTFSTWGESALPLTTAVTTAPEAKTTVTTTSYICILVTTIFQDHPYLSVYAPDNSQCYVGNTFRINYFAYCPASDYDDISWSSSDEKIAVIDSNGYVTITGGGTVTISADNGYTSDSVTFTISGKSDETMPVTTFFAPLTTSVTVLTQTLPTSVTSLLNETDIPAETTVVKGDISENGEIDLYDAIEICRYIMDMRPFTDAQKKTADYNSDGKVDLYDAIGIAKKLLEK